MELGKDSKSGAKIVNECGERAEKYGVVNQRPLESRNIFLLCLWPAA